MSKDSNAGDGLTKELKPVGQSEPDRLVLVAWMMTLPSDVQIVLWRLLEDERLGELEYIRVKMLESGIQADDLNIENVKRHIESARQARLEEVLAELSSSEDAVDGIPDGEFDSMDGEPSVADAVFMTGDAGLDTSADVPEPTFCNLYPLESDREVEADDTFRPLVDTVAHVSMSTEDEAGNGDAIPNATGDVLSEFNQSSPAQVSVEGTDDWMKFLDVSDEPDDAEDAETDALMDGFASSRVGTATQHSLPAVAGVLNDSGGGDGNVEILMHSRESSASLMVSVASVLLAVVFGVLFFAQENNRANLADALDILDDKNAEIANLNNELRQIDRFNVDDGILDYPSYSEMSATISSLEEESEIRVNEIQRLRAKVTELQGSNASRKMAIEKLSQVFAKSKTGYSQAELESRIAKATANMQTQSKPKVVTKTVEVLGPERIVTKTVEVPGPERIVTKTVEVPGPERIVTKTVEVEVPGPERIVYRDPTPTDKIYSQAELESEVRKATAQIERETAIASLPISQKPVPVAQTARNNGSRVKVWHSTVRKRR